MTPKQQQAITRHGETIKAVFALPQDLDPVDLCKNLRRLERKAHTLAEDWCNGVIDSDLHDILADGILDKLDKILDFREMSIPVFLNSDPRGYALKLAEGWTVAYNATHSPRIHQDWGGYGILAPEIGKEG